MRNIYNDGDKVIVAFKHLMGEGPELLSGTIIGRANSDNLVDIWIVLLDKFIPDYQYRSIAVPHFVIKCMYSNDLFPYEGGFTTAFAI